MKRRRMNAIIFLVALMVAALGSCSGKEDTNAESSEKSGAGGGESLQTVTFVSPTALESYDYLAIYVSDYMGYFEEEGLEVKYVEQIGADDVKMVAAGTADFAYPSPGVFMSGIDAGIDNVVAVCNYDSIQIFGLAVNKESGIKSWPDVKGKDIALYSESWTPLISPLLDASGMSVADVNMVSYGEGRYEAVASGKAPALGTWLSEYCQLVGQGYDLDYLDGNEVCPQVSNSLCTSRKLIKEDPELVKKFIRAFTKGMYFCYLNEEAAADITLLTCPNLQINWEGALGATKGDVMQIFGTTEEAQAEAIAKGIGFFEIEMCQNAADNLLKSGAISKKIDANDYYTNDFIDTGWDKSAIESDAEAYVCSSEAYKAAH